MLKQRVITGLLLGIVVIGCIFVPDTLYFRILLAVMLFVGATELVSMTLGKHLGLQLAIGGVMVALFVLSFPYNGIRFSFYHSFAGAFAWLAIPVLMTQYRYSGNWSFPVRLLVGMFTLALMWICLQGLVFVHAHFSYGPWLLLYLLSLVWVADTGAYFAGKKFGKNKLAPAISPGKTLEGVAGGVVANILWISLIFSLNDGWGIQYPYFLLLSLVTSLISVVGDLYESVLKREAGFKDSGKILPGHGGVLDRIDSIIAATPVFIAGLFILEAV